jgi:hypothetical protein
VKRPRQFSSSSYSQLCSDVTGGEYRRYDGLDALPATLRSIAGFARSSDYVSTLVMASSTSSHPPTIGGIAPAPNAPIIRVAPMRTDRHGPDGEWHLNRDDVLLFQDTKGNVWQQPAENGTAHYVALSSDSGLDEALKVHAVPPAPTGTLEELRSAGALVHFSTSLGTGSI